MRIPPSVIDALGRGGAVIASCSGGKDSTATTLLLKELEIPHERIFMDTGWENATTYEYLRDYLPGAVGPIRWLRAEFALDEEREVMAREVEEILGISPSPFVRLVLKKGMFPARVLRFCTEYLKACPATSYMKSLIKKDSEREERDPKEPPLAIINATGVRRQESRARSQLPETEPPGNFGPCLVWRPLLHWSEGDVIALHKRHGIKPNPNYLQGSSRVGCWPCIFSRKEEIRHMARLDPKRVEAIRRLEELVGVLARRRAEAKGEKMTAEERDTVDLEGLLDITGVPRYSRPTFFRAPTSSPGSGVDAHEWPIDRVIGWSRTARGGRQQELFDLPNNERGCLRWGLCEATPEEDCRAEAAAGEGD